MRRALAVGTGLAMATTTAVVVLSAGVVVALIDAPADRSAWMTLLFGAVLTLVGAPHPDQVIGAAVQAVWAMVVTVCCVPVVIVALIGEVTGWREVGWLVGGTSVLTALLPTLVAATDRAAAFVGRGQDRVELLVLLVVGACAGGSYWLVAGSSVKSAKAGTTMRPRL